MKRDPNSFAEHLAGQSRMADWHAIECRGHTQELNRRLEAGHHSKELDGLIKKAIREAHDTLFFLIRIEHARLIEYFYDVDALVPSKRRAKSLRQMERRG